MLEQSGRGCCGVQLAVQSSRVQEGQLTNPVEDGSEQSLLLRRERVLAYARARVWGVLGAGVAGVTVASRVELSAWQDWWGALFLACAAIAIAATLIVRQSRWCVWMLGFVAAALVGAGAWWVSVVHVPSDRLSEPGLQRDQIVTVEGLIMGAPRVLGPGQAVFMQPRTEFALSVRGIVMHGVVQQASGVIRVRVAGSKSDGVQPGDAVRVMGRFAPVVPATNPGEPDRIALARGKGEVGSLTTSSWELVTPCERLAHARVGDGVLTWLVSMRDRGKQAVLASLPSEPQARWLMSALLLGESEQRDDEAMSAFARVGVIHLVAISGFHLTVIAMVLLWLMRLLGDRGWIEPVVVASGLIAYATLTPLSPALLRAVVLTLLVLATQSAGRKADSLCVLGLGAFGIVLYAPLAVLDLGFQLSLGLTALLLWAQQSFAARFAGLPPAGVLHERLTPAQWVWRGMRTASAASVMCWIVSVPWMMASVGIVSPAGLIASLLLAPAFVVLLVGGVVCGAAGAVVGVVAPQVVAWITEHVTGPALAWVCNLVMQAVQIADGLPGAWTWVPTTPWWWALYASVVLACWARFGMRAPGASVRRSLIAAVAIAVLSLPVAWQTRTALSRDVLLRVDMLDVGDGTCMLVRTREGAMLWDVKRARWARTHPGVLAACRELGAWHVPTVVISHPDSDHCTGLAEVLSPLGVREVFTTQRFVEAAAGPQAQLLIADVLASIKNAGAKVTVLHRGSTVALSNDVMAKALWPEAKSDRDDSGKLSDNDSSLVLAIDIPTKARSARVLLTGDVQNEAARTVAEMLARESGAWVAIAEAPHHGAANGGGIALLAAARARVVLQSTGQSRLDDPRLESVRQGEWLVTARDGWAWAEVLRSGEIRFAK